jgi:hypothetical protein
LDVVGASVTMADFMNPLINSSGCS